MTNTESSETPANLSLDSFRAWLRTKPPSESYGYLDGQDCAWAQFLKAQGYTDYSVGGHRFWIGDNPYALPDEVIEELCDIPQTFGGLRKRLEPSIVAKVLAWWGQ